MHKIAIKKIAFARKNFLMDAQSGDQKNNFCEKNFSHELTKWRPKNNFSEEKLPHEYEEMATNISNSSLLRGSMVTKYISWQPNVVPFRDKIFSH